MRRWSSLLLLFIVTLPSWAASSRSASPLCDDSLPLPVFVAQVGKYAKRKPRACVEYCYSRYLSNRAFSTGTPLDQEEFLFEYLQACLDAAKEPVRKKFFQQAIDVARQYIDWFVDERARNNVLASRDAHLATVIFELGDTYKELNDSPHLLDAYGQYAPQCPYAFRREDTIDRWLSALRSYKSTAGTERTWQESRDALDKINLQREDWNLFLKTLLDLEAKYHIHGYADALDFAQRVLKQESALNIKRKRP
jgi:hypothetical protein